MNKSGVRLLVPDGSLQKIVEELMAKAGMALSTSSSRSYMVTVNNPRLFPPPFNLARRLRPQDATWIVADGLADLAFVAEDLIEESGRASDLVVLRYIPKSRGGRQMTRIVLAVPNDSAIKSIAELMPNHEVVTEYPVIAAKWFGQHGVSPRVRRCAGSLEAYVEIADAIVENVETGESLGENRWREIGEYMHSRTCLITNRLAVENPDQKAIIDEVCLLIGSVIDAVGRISLKCNATPTVVGAVTGILQQYGDPTISLLAADAGSAMEIVVNEAEAETLMPLLKAALATRIITTPINQFIE